MRALAAAWRAFASSGVARVLVLNVVPILGVLLFGWNVWEIFLLYLIETGFIGLAALPRIGAAEGSPAPSSDEPRMERGNLAVSFATGCAAQLLFVGAMVFTLVPKWLGPGSDRIEAPFVFLVAVLIAAVAQWQAYRRFIETDEYLRVTPFSQSWAPFRRITVLLFTVVVASFIGVALPGLGPPLLLILGKASVEAAAELEIGWFRD